MALSYVLPIRTDYAAAVELFDYLAWLACRAQVLVVDGSRPDIFSAHADRCVAGIRHIRPDPDLLHLANGKVAGALTGVRHATNDAVIVADEDVRYGHAELRAMARALDTAQVVRPQNYFDPLPWHACIDTARTLLNRISGGDWPGTLGVSRSALLRAGGYDGDVLFENLELVRTIAAAGGIEKVALDLYVRRLPPPTKHFWSQRVRQAYDEFARPARLLAWLAILPTVLLLIARGRGTVLAEAAVAAVVAAEVGRRRAGGARVFPQAAAFAAPVWLCERAICSWVAIAARVLIGGIPYRGRIVARAATPRRVLAARLNQPTPC